MSLKTIIPPGYRGFILAVIALTIALALGLYAGPENLQNMGGTYSGLGLLIGAALGVREIKKLSAGKAEKDDKEGS